MKIGSQYTGLYDLQRIYLNDKGISPSTPKKKNRSELPFVLIIHKHHTVVGILQLLLTG